MDKRSSVGGAVLLLASLGACSKQNAAGLDGAGGASGPYSCSVEQVLDCPNALSLDDGHVTTFSNLEWSNTSGKFCDASGLRGAVYGYSGMIWPPDGGPPSAATHSVDPSAQNFSLRLTAAPGDYAGGGMSFDHCVNASSFTALRFSAALAQGDLTGCTLKVLIRTYDQLSDTQVPAGGCVSYCYNYPSAPITAALGAKPTTITLPFSAFTASVPPTAPPPGQIVGLQWEIDAAELSSGCRVDLRIDDVEFVTQ